MTRVCNECRKSVRIAPLHHAALNGHVECLKRLVRDGANLNVATSRKRMTPLHLATMNNHAECVAILLRAGACYLLKSLRGDTSLDMALWMDRRECVVAHVQNLNPNPAMRTHNIIYMEWALNRVVLRGNIELVEFLLDAGFDPASLSLHAAIYNEQMLRLVMLRRPNTDLDRPQGYGGLLFYATGCRCAHRAVCKIHPPRRRRPELARLLLGHGASPDAYKSCPTGKNSLLEREMLVERPNEIILNAVCHVTKNLRRLEDLPCGKIVKKRRPGLARRYEEIAGSPRTLLHYCRSSIRECLTKYRLCRVYELPIPDLLAKYLLLGWSDEQLFSSSDCMEVVPP